jgi:hypothetical protein
MTNYDNTNNRGLGYYLSAGKSENCGHLDSVYGTKNTYVNTTDNSNTSNNSSGSGSAHYRGSYESAGPDTSSNSKISGCFGCLAGITLPVLAMAFFGYSIYRENQKSIEKQKEVDRIVREIFDDEYNKLFNENDNRNSDK